VTTAGAPTPAPAAPTPAEQIRAMLPDHTHAKRELAGGTVWTWTTPDGTWGVTLSPAGYLKFVGPGGDWSFGRTGPDGKVRQLRGVLLALGAIGGVEAEIRALLSDASPVRVPSREQVEAMCDTHDAGRRVLEAARDWRRNYGNTSLAYADACTRLVAAVDELEAATAREESLRNASAGPPGSRHSAARHQPVGRDASATETGSEGRETRGRNDG
jgi:hypothetical protein